MASINTNVPALTAQHYLKRSQETLTTSLERLASGLRINRGADDPAGLIVSENLRAEVAAVGQAIENTQRASLVIATAEGALNEVAALLIDAVHCQLERVFPGCDVFGAAVTVDVRWTGQRVVVRGVDRDGCR